MFGRTDVAGRSVVAAQYTSPNDHGVSRFQPLFMHLCVCPLDEKQILCTISKTSKRLYPAS